MNLSVISSTKSVKDPDVQRNQQSQLVHARVARSGFAMILRQLLTKPMAFVANIVLARLLIPEQFGIYSIVATTVSLFTIFGDAGLAPALIRSEHQPSEEEEASIFTLQQIIVGVPLLLLSIFAPLVVAAFHTSDHYDWLVRMVAISGLIATFRVIPSVRLSRRLQLDTIANIEIAESFSFNAIVITLAFLHFGVWSFALASLASRGCGLWLTYAAEPWRVKWSLNWGICKQALKFGIKFQLLSIVNCVRDSVTTAWIGLMCGATAVGFTTFAYTTAQYPFLLGSAFAGLYLPLFSHVQADKDAVTKAAETAIRANNVLIFGLASVLVPTAPLLMIFVFGPKWLPAIPLMYCLLLPVLFFGTNNTVTGICHALGRADIPLRFSCWLTAGSLFAYIPLIKMLGPIGFGVAQPVLVLFNIPMYREVLKLVPLKILRQTLPTLGAAVLNACLCAVALHWIQIQNVFQLLGFCLASFAVFLVIANAIWKNQLWHELVQVTRILIERKALSSASTQTA